MNAAAIAGLWGGRDLHLISTRENAVYRMTLPGGALAALRLHRPGYQTQDGIRSELWWCRALADAGLPVPCPIPSNRGQMAEDAQGQLASAVTWLQGAALGRAGQPFDLPVTVVADRHHALGRLIAQVHAATDRLALPEGFTRPRWDRAGLVGERPVWGRFWDHPLASPQQRAILHRARELLAAELADPALDQGLIHADVLRENVLVDGDSLSLIDFDDSGFGFRLYDLGTVLSQNLHEPDYPAIRDALIAGYGETRPASRHLVEVFTLARCCASVGWMMPRLAADDPVHPRHIARACDFALRLGLG